MILTNLSCNLCGAFSFNIVHQFPHYGTSILLCQRCGLMMNYPFPAPKEIYEKYQEDFYSFEGERFKGWIEVLSYFFRVRRAVFIDRQFGPKKTILDVGCGRGIMLNELKKRGWSVSGTQISETATAKIRRSFGIDCFIGDLPSSPFPRNSFDIITMWHVLEHLIDPFLYLRYCRKILKPEGYLLIEVPNANSWTSRIIKDAWMGWDPAHHLYHFTPFVLNLALKKTGFIPVKWAHFSWEYGPFTTLQSFLNLFGERDALFSALKINSGNIFFTYKALKRIIFLFGKAFFLAAPSFTISRLSAACGHGEVIRVLAKPEV
jgi:SAM-dependent methyltransferase